MYTWITCFKKEKQDFFLHLDEMNVMDGDSELARSGKEAESETERMELI